MELSICTVSFWNATEIAWHVDLARQLNPDVRLRWIIVDNAPGEASAPLRALAGEVSLLAGVEPIHTPHYHHTLALARAIEQADTRFVLVIDPDFFVVREGWASTMMAHMQAQELAILGVPWHPRRTDKYRYFPAVHCALFDTERFPRTEIDFQPDFPNGDNDPTWPRGYLPEENYFTVNPLSRLLARLPPLRVRRVFYIDTGSRLYKKYIRDRSLAFELIEPVYDPSRHSVTLKGSTRWLERLLPDELCYVPKYYRDTHDRGFIQGYTDQPIPTEWEEFIWQDRPFGFHMRRNAHVEQRSKEEEKAVAGKIVANIRTRGGTAPG